MSKPKRHHYVPQCYSEKFANAAGYLYLYDKWEDRAFPSKPADALAIGNLYRQPVHAEKRFDVGIEKFFSDVEKHWPSIFKAIAQKETISQEQWGNLVEFISAQIVRVPLCLNSVIELLRYDALGAVDQIELSPLPPELSAFLEKKGKQPTIKLRSMIEDDLDSLNIDPHRCLTSLPLLVKAIPIFRPGFSFGIPKFLHNKSNLKFVSSDNPAIFFSGRPDSKKYHPHEIQNHNSFTFFFPLSPDLAMVNRPFDSKNAMHSEIWDDARVALMNRAISAFSYRYVISGEEKLCIGFGRRSYRRCPRPIYDRSSVLDGNVAHICLLYTSDAADE